MKTPPSNIPPVPEGFEYFGEGPLPFSEKHPTSDIALCHPDWGFWSPASATGSLSKVYYALRIGSEVHRKNMPKEEETTLEDSAAAVCDLWQDLFVEIGRALGMTHGNGNDVLAEVKRRVQAHAEVVAAFDVARSALAIVRKERDEKAEQLQIALKEKKMLSNAILTPCHP